RDSSIEIFSSFSSFLASKTEIIFLSLSFSLRSSARLWEITAFAVAASVTADDTANCSAADCLRGCSFRSFHQDRISSPTFTIATKNPADPAPVRTLAHIHRLPARLTEFTVSRDLVITRTLIRQPIAI